MRIQSGGMSDYSATDLVVHGSSTAISGSCLGTYVSQQDVNTYENDGDVTTADSDSR